MGYHKIDHEEKRNIPFRAIPFCIEEDAIDRDDVLHTHDFNQLTVITDGRAEIIVNGHGHSIAQGDVYVIPGFSSHGLCKVRSLQLVNILYYQTDLLNAAGSLKRDDNFENFFVLQPSRVWGGAPSNHLRLGFDDFQTIQRLFEAMRNEAAAEAPGGEQMLNALFMETVVLLTRAYGAGREPRPARAASLFKAIAHMEREYAGDVSIKEMARLSNQSERQFRSCFREKFRQTPKEYVIDLRLKRACHLLAHTDFSVGEIAEQCGFVDSSYFARLFRKRLGVSPSRYRLDNRA